MVPEASLAAIVGRGRAAIAFFAGPSLGIGIELLSHHPNLKRISLRPIRSQLFIGVYYTGQSAHVEACLRLGDPASWLPLLARGWVGAS